MRPPPPPSFGSSLPLSSSVSRSSGSQTTVLPRCVPWALWEEWTLVKQALFSSSPQKKRLAIKRIAAWRSREKVPVSVEATSDLVEILLGDVELNGGEGKEEREEEEDRRSEMELRLLYSMALLRFVNGLVEPLQQSVYAQSIRTLAKRIDLPLSFVDLRHDATHNVLPTLSVLRTAAQEALFWLQDHYWERQHEFLSTLKEETWNTLAQFRQKISKALSWVRKQRKRKEGIELINSSHLELRKKLVSLGEVLDVTISFLVSLICKTVRPNTPLMGGEGAHWQRVILVTLPKVWPNFLPMLSLSLCEEIVAGSKELRSKEHLFNANTPLLQLNKTIELATAWLSLILNTNSSSSSASSNLEPLPLRSIFGMAAQQPGSWTKKIVDHPSMRRFLRTRLQDQRLGPQLSGLMALFSSSATSSVVSTSTSDSLKKVRRQPSEPPSSSSSSTSASLLSLQDLQALLAREKNQVSRRKGKGLEESEGRNKEEVEAKEKGNEESGWEQPSTYGLSPLGVLPGEVVTAHLHLQLPSYLDSLQGATFLTSLPPPPPTSHPSQQEQHRQLKVQPPPPSPPLPTPTPPPLSSSPSSISLLHPEPASQPQIFPRSFDPTARKIEGAVEKLKTKGEESKGWREEVERVQQNIATSFPLDELLF